MSAYIRIITGASGENSPDKDLPILYIECQERF
jgi:hypothetical protein